MRENSLGLVDVMDSIEALEEFEAVFKIGIENDEAETIETVGDLFDAILAKLPPIESGKCATAMAFYRLRRALGQDALTPSSNLFHLNAAGAKRALADLCAKTGLSVPSARYARLGNIGCAIAAISALVFAVTLIAFFSNDAPMALAGIVGSVVLLSLGIVATRMDKGLLPRDCEALGGLTRATARASYGQLVRLGAQAREDEIWEIVTTTLANCANISASDIDRDTTWYKGQQRKAA